MNPLVSVVLPVYNGGKFLARAVESILSQDHSNLELLLIDDRSTDGAIAALGKDDTRLNVFKSRGRGVVDAFNTGFALCRGAYIARMDADDISLPERISCQRSTWLTTRWWILPVAGWIFFQRAVSRVVWNVTSTG